MPWERVLSLGLGGFEAPQAPAAVPPSLKALHSALALESLSLSGGSGGLGQGLMLRLAPPCQADLVEQLLRVGTGPGSRDFSFSFWGGALPFDCIGRSFEC